LEKGGIILVLTERLLSENVKTEKKLALSMALSALAQDNNLVLVDLINIEQQETKCCSFLEKP
jgi:ribosomal protein L4